jgi:DNA (cytosine-5)-methyltransferase 1
MGKYAAMAKQDNFIPVIDLFAGPGGLGEGFSSVHDEQGKHFFKVVLSIEKEQYAHQTLELRALFREFGDKVPDEYYKYLRGEITREELFDKNPEQAKAAASVAWHAELGAKEFPPEVVDQRIRSVLGNAQSWVLTGGPPCQAYSVIGRSRICGKNPEDYESDPRHWLYKEYLRILAVHMPPVFIMENVKGLLSAKLNGDNIFSKILSDLQNPVKYRSDIIPAEYQIKNSTNYRLYSLSEPVWNLSGPASFVVKMKDYGIPQDRHRIIILGIRGDINVKPGLLNKSQEIIPVRRVIEDLPKLRSTLSKEKDSSTAWRDAIKYICNSNWISDIKITPELIAKMISLAERVRKIRSTGGRYIKTTREPKYLPGWYRDERLQGICNHHARSHIREDIHRYFFVSCFALVHKRTPLLRDFPEALLPEHENAKDAVANGNGIFADRFRVQLRNHPATTITSHIAKDGHYYIHPDPLQCRSLTVREAARIQTFPDNYFFEGPQTSQYQQVGNAVPPLLARQIAHVVYAVLTKAEEITAHGLVADKLLANEST